MRTYLCIQFMLCLFVNATAQKTYKPGDTITNLRQYVPNPKKLVILDFWSLDCSACISQFPKLDSLQCEFDSEIEIILVNQDKVSDSSRINKYVRKTTLQSIIGDSLLVNAFPHRSVPHYVWLNGAGKVVGQTHSKELAAKNIQSFLDGTLQSLVTKGDVYRYFPARDSLGTGRFRSIILPMQLHLSRGSGNLIDKHWNLTKAFAINADMSKLIQMAYLYERKKPKSIPRNDSLYCYELVIPPTPHKEAYRYMQADLERYFGIKRPKYGLFSRKKFL